MKVVLALVALIGLVSAEHYTTKYDSIDIDNILSNSRLLTFYLDCLLDERSCNDEGKTLKSVIPDALITDCKKCNKIQHASVDKVIKFLIDHRQADWKKLIAKYDSTGKYWDMYKHYLN